MRLQDLAYCIVLATSISFIIWRATPEKAHHSPSYISFAQLNLSQTSHAILNITELHILLDQELESKPTPTQFTTLTNQQYLNLSNPNNYYSEYEHTTDLLSDSPTEHHLINAFLHAYNHHVPLKLRPDDIQLAITMVISTFVNKHAEELRPLFVAHQGKKTLKVEYNEFNPLVFTHGFKHRIRSNIKDPMFAHHITATYTTTTALLSVVNNLALMNTLKEYFEYMISITCGIPSIILTGSQEDWQQLDTHYQYFKQLFVGKELDAWFKHFDHVIQLLLEMRMLGTEGQVQAPTNISHIWKNVISTSSHGCGEAYLGGWARLFVPYTDEHALIDGLADTSLSFFHSSEPQSLYMNAWSTVPASIFTTPAKIDANGVEYDVELNAGFYPARFQDGAVVSNVGLQMTGNLKEQENIRRDAIRKKYN